MHRSRYAPIRIASRSVKPARRSWAKAAAVRHRAGRRRGAAGGRGRGRWILSMPVSPLPRPGVSATLARGGDMKQGRLVLPALPRDGRRPVHGRQPRGRGPGGPMVRWSAGRGRQRRLRRLAAGDGQAGSTRPPLVPRSTLHAPRYGRTADAGLLAEHSEARGFADSVRRRSRSSVPYMSAYFESMTCGCA